MKTGWVQGVLEKVAAQDTGKPGQVVIAPSQLDRHYREIRSLNNKLVVLETEKGKKQLEEEAAAKVFIDWYAANDAEATKLRAQMREHQQAMIDGLNSCGIKAEIVG